MKATKETYCAAVLFAADDGYNEITYETMYKGCVVYYATDEAEAGACVGYPAFIIVNNDLLCRYANTDECLEIMEK